MKQARRSLRLASPVMALAILAACSDLQAPMEPVAVDSEPLAKRAGTVHSVTVSPANATLSVGSSTTLQATVQDRSGTVLTDRTVSWQSSNTAVTTVSATGVVQGLAAGQATITATSEGRSGTATITITSGATVSPTPGANPLETAAFYVDPYSNAARQVAAWRTTRPADALELEKISTRPQAFWIGSWYSDVRAAVNDIVTRSIAAGAMPVLVLYNIPQRDCGSYSAGGASSGDAYRSWISAVGAGIGGRRSAVILEPDAIANASCLSATDQELRFQLLREAVVSLKSAGALVYIDAGHSAWLSVSTAVERLKRAGVADAQGFSLNVSNFQSNTNSANYGSAISQSIGGKHFIIDTSRNGLGPGSTWCNPDGRALGTAPTGRTGHALIDAFLWVKRPGESDGTCNGGPSAGSWWADYALAVAQRTTTTMLAATLSSPIVALR